jgi:hypothetical protein
MNQASESTIQSKRLSNLILRRKVSIYFLATYLMGVLPIFYSYWFCRSDPPPQSSDFSGLLTQPTRRRPMIVLAISYIYSLFTPYEVISYKRNSFDTILTNLRAF